MSITEIQSSSFLQANSIVLWILKKLLYIRKKKKEREREQEKIIEEQKEKSIKIR